jgi:hypothetical protein
MPVILSLIREDKQRVWMDAQQSLNNPPLLLLVDLLGTQPRVNDLELSPDSTISQ